MMLPKISQPTFTTNLPSDNKKVTFRPFTVREEKILLVAQSAADPQSMVQAMKQIITNCVAEEIDVDTLPSFDIEWLFLQLRAKSVSNIIELRTSDDDGKEINIKIDLNEVQVKKATISNKVLLSEEQTIGVILRYPTFSVIEKLGNFNGESNDQSQLAFELFKEIVVAIYDAEDVYDVKQAAPGELDEFLQSLNADQFKKIQAFLEDMPYIYMDVNYKTSKGEDKSFRLQGLQDFFG
jgi:hypothetical protein